MYQPKYTQYILFCWRKYLINYTPWIQNLYVDNTNNTTATRVYRYYCKFDTIISVMKKIQMFFVVYNNFSKKASGIPVVS